MELFKFIKFCEIKPRAKKSSQNYLIDSNNYEIIRNINTGCFNALNLVRNTKNWK